MKSKFSALIVIVLIILSFNSCEKNEIVQAPTIPPAETMVIDFGKLANANKSAPIAENDLVTKTNWLFAASTVGIWNIIIGTTFAVPVAAFKASFSQIPSKINNTWEWKYSVDGFTSQYSARLVGTLQTSQVKWEMYISKTGVDSFEEFLWFEGTSALDGKSGQWILYHSADFPEKTVQIDWQKEGDKIGNVKYSYVRDLNNERQSDNFNGSYLIYGLQDQTFDAFVTVHAYNFQTENFTDTSIEWSRSDFSGHVKAEQYFNDTAWHCWDSAGNDIDCN
ncbi:MAG TPA: hypothetical protein VKA38_06440 [Draconibacterium sp.]|nr:hypothetical protein [Draconibacterium sp.]